MVYLFYLNQYPNLHDEQYYCATHGNIVNEYFLIILCSALNSFSIRSE